MHLVGSGRRGSLNPDVDQELIKKGRGYRPNEALATCFSDAEQGANSYYAVSVER